MGKEEGRREEGGGRREEGGGRREEGGGRREEGRREEGTHTSATKHWVLVLLEDNLPLLLRDSWSACSPNSLSVASQP